MVGVGLSSLLTNVVRIILHLIKPDYITEALVFFGISTMFGAFCTVLSYKFIESSDTGCRPEIDNSQFTFKKIWLRIWEVYCKNGIMALSILVTFTIQYTFYPGVMLSSSLEPTFFTDFSWFVITLVTYHSFWDTVGRYLAGIFNILPKKVFLWACLSRIIFVVFYMLMHDGKDPSLWASNWFIIVNLTLFSFTCGYLSTLGMNYGSDETTLNQSLAGSIMGFHLTFGICLGSAIALICLS